jgi:polyisoprenoid-binding protein YceI
MSIATQPFQGTYTADPVHSTFAFGVRHMGLSTFRGQLTEVEATLGGDDGGLALDGRARAESISVQNPPQLRDHLLGEEFFDAESHPYVEFRSTAIDLADDGSARVEGALTIRGTTRPVVATGTWREPRDLGHGRVVGALQLEATFDRREFGFDWQMETPGGGIALDYDVTLSVQIELVRQGAEA